MAKRRRVEILAAVLHSAVGGARKTRIMQNANLNHSLLEKYLEETVDLGFLQSGNCLYETTEKGMRFLEVFLRFSSKHSKLREMLEASRSDWMVLEQMCDRANNGKSRSDDVRLGQLAPRMVAQNAR